MRPFVRAEASPCPFGADGIVKDVLNPFHLEIGTTSHNARSEENCKLTDRERLYRQETKLAA